MPPIRYGVLRGRPGRSQRHDSVASNQLQIRILDDTHQSWRIAVDVRSSENSEVVCWLVDSLAGHLLLDGLRELPTGFTSQAADSATALDFVRFPLFEFEIGRVLPPTGSSEANDLQDLLSLYLEQCRAAGGEIFVFGAKFTTDEQARRPLPIDTEFGNLDGLHGVHDIHMNQGNVGEFVRDNGAGQDGGLVLSFSERHVGLFLAFSTQLVPTDSTGSPTASARSIGDLLGRPKSTTPQPR